MGKTKNIRIAIDSAFFDRTIEKLRDTSSRKAAIEVWIGKLGKERVESLAVAISQNKKLKDLHVRAYEDYRTEEMALFFEKLADLQVRHLQSIFIEASLKDGVLPAVKKYFEINNSVESLKIHDMENGHSVFSCVRFVKTLNLKESGAISESKIASVHHLIQTGCERLLIAPKNINAMNRLYDALRDSSSLSTLRIYVPSVMRDEAAFVEVLSTISSLNFLTLCLSSTNRTARMDLFRSVATLTGLEHLQVRCSLAELEALSPIIQRLKSLTLRLRRWNNNPDDGDSDKVARVIGTVLGASPMDSLTVNWSGNKMPDGLASSLLNALPPGLGKLELQVPLTRQERGQLVTVIRSRQQLTKVTLDADEPAKFKKEVEYYTTEHRLLSPLLRTGPISYYPLALSKLSKKTPSAVYYLLIQKCGELFPHSRSTTSDDETSRIDHSTALAPAQDSAFGETDEINSMTTDSSVETELWLEHARTVAGPLVWKGDSVPGNSDRFAVCAGGNCQCSVM